MAVTSSKFSTDFQNSFTGGKRRKFPTKSMGYFPPRLKYVAAIPLGI